MSNHLWNAVPETLSRKFVSVVEIQPTTGPSHELSELRRILSSLTPQQLDLLLQLPRRCGDVFLLGKTLTEVLLHFIPGTGPENQGWILETLAFVFLHNPSTHSFAVGHLQPLEDLANSRDGFLAKTARDVLKLLEQDPPSPIVLKHTFKPNEQFYFDQLMRISMQHAGAVVRVFDNWADAVILDYIERFADTAVLTHIQIVTDARNQKGVRALKHSAEAFKNQFPHVQFELRTSKEIHDRYVFLVDKQDVWHLGPSVKDGGDKVASAFRIVADVDQSIAALNDGWAKATVI